MFSVHQLITLVPMSTRPLGIASTGESTGTLRLPGSVVVMYHHERSAAIGADALWSLRHRAQVVQITHVGTAYCEIQRVQHHQHRTVQLDSSAELGRVVDLAEVWRSTCAVR
jgi:hypothetical protein